MPPEVQGFLAGVTLADVFTWLGAALAVFASVKWVIPFARKVSHFIDDVAGEPARPGVPARPGLMERVTTVEETQGAQGVVLATVQRKQGEHSESLATISHEVTTNHGSSLKDEVKEINTVVKDLAAWQMQHQTTSDAVVARVDVLERKKDES